SIAARQSAPNAAAGWRLENVTGLTRFSYFVTGFREPGHRTPLVAFLIGAARAGNVRCTASISGNGCYRPEDATVRSGLVHTSDYLKRIGVPDVARATSPFDPGYDPWTFAGHLQQSAHLMSTLKISMACWMVANETVTRAKVALAREHGVSTVTGGGPFEIA